jgi:hypothetical protein
MPLSHKRFFRYLKNLYVWLATELSRSVAINSAEIMEFFNLRIFLFVESSECVFPVSNVLLFTDVVPDNDVRIRISDNECCISDHYGVA